jgi:hypothetical protein
MAGYGQLMIFKEAEQENPSLRLSRRQPGTCVIAVTAPSRTFE